MQKDYKISLLLDFYGNMLTGKQREAIELYYNEDLSLAEIAEHTGITRQGVRDAIKRAEAQLLELEEKLALWGRSQEIRQGFEDIEALASALVGENESRGFSKEIDDSARRIIEIARELNE